MIFKFETASINMSLNISTMMILLYGLCCLQPSSSFRWQRMEPKLTRKAKRWTVRIDINNQTMCGGVLVHGRWVLTQAECVNTRYCNYVVDISRQNITVTKEYRKSPTVQSLVLLKFDQEVNLTSTLFMVPRLSTKKDKNVSIKRKIKSRIFNWNSSNVLKELKVRIASYTDCKQQHSDGYYDEKHRLCYATVSQENDNSECNLIRGLPIMSRISEKWTIVGITILEEEELSSRQLEFHV